MNKKVLALFLCCALVFGMVPAALSTAFSASSDFTIYGSNGAPTDSITLPQNDKTTLTAVAETGSGYYQWQIRVSDSVWANIVGSTGTSLELSYAMVANLLSGDRVDIRCRLTNDVNNVTYSNIVAVTVEAQPLRVSAKRAPTAGRVISGAEPIGEPIISGAPDSVQSSPDGTPAADDTGSSNEETPSTYSIVINYVFENGNTAAPSWTATVATGTTYQQTVMSPVVLGYTPDQETVTVDASGETTYTVTYSPAEVEYTVKHWQQKVENDDYDLVATETKTGYTKTAVGGELAKTYEGFYSLLYDTTTEIAADGSTNIDVYYDRYYYLMSFDLDGGYGVEPIYARYGAKIEVGTPTKAGYTFNGWDKEIPATMPAENSSYKAKWEAGTSGFTVVFWYENADDDGYSVAGRYTPADVQPGTEKKSEEYQNYKFTGRDDDHFTYNAEKAQTVTVSGDGSTVLNVYFTRNTYTLTFKNGQQTLTCTKTEHEHSHDECCTKTGWHVNCNANKCPVGYAHTHDSRCYKYSDLKITAKYGADIHGYFPIKDGNDTIWWDVPSGCKSFKPGTQLGSIDTMPGENITFTKDDSESGADIYYYIEALEGQTGTYTHGGKNFILYKTINISRSGYLTYTEEFHNIAGFTQWWSDPAFNKMEQGGRTSGIYEKNYLCYTRNSYNLQFYNYNDYVVGKGGSVQYEASLAGYNFTPDYPAGLEPNAYVFAGWYTTAGCYEGSEADLNTMTMPASDVILYAKWTPKTHTVKTYLTKEAMDNGEAALNTWPAVPHGTTVEKPKDPENGEYKFVGWFYTSDTGEEKAFDFSMPVNRDLNLYAKWSSNKLMTYIIRYQLEDGTDIAAPTTGSALAGTTKTFDAKTGTQLNEGYQSGYFPLTSSHSLTIDINGTADNKLNEYIFVYVPKAEVSYTVRYLEKDTNNVLHEEKHAATRDAVITEKFEQITGYAPDAYQKRLVLSADEEQNVITFWYVKDEDHAPVQIIHWKQNIEGEDYTEYQSSTNLNGMIDQTYSENPLTIPGFTYNSEDSNASGELTAEGLVLNLYYDRIAYPYEFRFLEQGTDKVLADPVTGSKRYEAQVTQTAKTIPGYKLVTGAQESQMIKIAIEDPADKANRNVKTFYYVEDTVVIKYQVVGPTTGSGTLDNYQDNKIGVLTGDSLKGSAPTAADGFKFVGWFKDEACEELVDTTWVDTNNKLTPERTKDYGSGKMGYEAATYYAKFEYDVADLTITKQGCQNIDENQSFLFDVTGPGINGTMRVAIKGNSSVTIKGLKIGEYTVTEVTKWSWRYSPDYGSQKITLKPAQTNAVNFVNSREKVKWLGGDAYCKNVFGSIN